jgi:hypothetical protein
MKEAVMKAPFPPPRSIEAVDELDVSAIDAVRRFVWQWFSAHRNDVILSRKIVFFSVTVRVHHLESVFVRLFGTNPYDDE